VDQLSNVESEEDSHNDAKRHCRGRRGQKGDKGHKGAKEQREKLVPEDRPNLLVRMLSSNTATPYGLQCGTRYTSYLHNILWKRCCVIHF